jgi:hypothetical protein
MGQAAPKLQRWKHKSLFPWQGFSLPGEEAATPLYRTPRERQTAPLTINSVGGAFLLPHVVTEKIVLVKPAH